MQNIDIQNIPNQEFNVVLDDNQWDITIKTVNDNIAVTLVLNGVLVIENLRAVAYQRIIPSQYKESGNFSFITLNQEIVDYRNFGITQNLIYFSANELAEARAENPVYPKDLDFNPLGALPLRYEPKGYVLAP